MKLRLALAATALSVVSAPALATSTDFETTGVGVPTIAGTGVGTSYANLGMTFDGAFYVQCGGGCPDPAFGMAISGEGSFAPFTVYFASPVSDFSAVNVTVSSVIATAYDLGGNVLGSDVSRTDFELDDLLLPFSDIAYITFAFDDPLLLNFGFAVDNFSFTPGTAIPEPGTWALMMLGLGATGIAIRRRHRRSKESAVAQLA